ncbi:MAG: hypothetical protein GYB68_10810, partial [Chloroflexi bacterium]|nr:hypothetical protein [Chloroflexota bacterium]
VPVIPVVFAAFILTFVILNSQAPYQHPDRFLLAYVITLPIIFSLPAILTGLESVTVDDSSHPNQGIFSSIENGVLAGAISAVVYFLAVFISQVILNDISRALVWGLFSLIWYFLWVGFLVGFAPALQHFVLRWMLHRDADTPLNYAAFLDHASRLILLRRVGGSYTFIHRSLLEYFAALEPETDGS